MSDKDAERLRNIAAAGTTAAVKAKIMAEIMAEIKATGKPDFSLL